MEDAGLDRRIPFLQEKCPDRGYLLWPGLTALPYALGTISSLEDAYMANTRYQTGGILLQCASAAPSKGFLRNSRARNVQRTVGGNF